MCRGKTVWRPSLCCASCENPTWHGAGVCLIEAAHFVGFVRAVFSTSVRDVHPVRTACICPWKRLQEPVGLAVCVDICSEAQMCPDSQPAGVSVESLESVKEAFTPPKWVCADSNTLGLISGVIADICSCLFLFFGTAASTCKLTREKIWGFSYQASVPGISI